jgi:hypothetical protein
LSGELLQELATAVEQLTQWTRVVLPQDFFERTVAYAFVDEVKDRDVKQNLLIIGERFLSEKVLILMYRMVVYFCIGEPVSSNAQYW